MVKNFEEKMRQYAAVVINIGVNVQPGQRLLIGPFGSSRKGVPLEAAPLVRMLAEEAYKAGARDVDVNWHDPALDRIRYDLASSDGHDYVPSWRADLTRDFLASGDAVVSIYAPTPGLLDGVPEEFVRASQTAQRQLSGPLMNFITTNAVNWCVIAYPTPAWAAQVASDLSTTEERINAVWELIFDICRVNETDPVAEWAAHVKRLTARAEYLNARGYSALHYTAPGTDLEVGLPDGHIWTAAESVSQGGVTFTANVPTEEIFSLPHRERVNGHVTATMPLVYADTLMDEFSLTFQNGSVIKHSAKVGESTLEHLLNTDEGARRLGEVALVPYSSPISQSGRLFYNTLYDENASCHVALGKAYQFTLEGGVDMELDQFAAAGGNESKIHVDFMIGSNQMDIDGVRADGTTEPLMRAGEFAFDA